MSGRQILIVLLMLSALIVPLIELSIGFYYVNSVQLCPLQNDIMVLMSIGGVFVAIFFAAFFGFLFSITPAKYKKAKTLAEGQSPAKSTNRWSQILIGGIMMIFAVCAMIFFVLLQVRVFPNYSRVQMTNANLNTYCLRTIFYGAFGLIVATYFAFLLAFAVTAVLLLGIGIAK